MQCSRDVTVTGITVKRGEILRDKDYRLCLNKCHYHGGFCKNSLIQVSQASSSIYPPKMQQRFHFETLCSY